MLLAVFLDHDSVVCYEVTPGEVHQVTRVLFQRRLVHHCKNYSCSLDTLWTACVCICQLLHMPYGIDRDKLFDKGYFIMSGDVKLLVLYFDTKHVKKVRTGHAEQLHR